MIEYALAFLDLRGERTTQRDIHLLDAAADRQQRHAALDRLADQGQGGCVAIGIVGAVGFAGVAAIERRMHIRLRAGHHDAVDRGQEFIEVEPIAEGRHQDRKDARAGNGGFQILPGSGVPGVVVELADIGRDGDERLVHFGIVFHWVQSWNAHKIGDTGAVFHDKFAALPRQVSRIAL